MNSQKHVLIVNGGKVEPVQLLLEDPPRQITLITEPAFADTYRHLPDVVLVDDIGDLKQVREAALEIIATRGPFDAVIAPSERSLPTGGYLRSYFGLPGISFDVANVCCNKYAMKRRLQQAGIAAASSILAPGQSDLPAAVARIGLPVVIKPAFGCGSTFTEVVRNEGELTGIPGRSMSDRFQNAPGPFVVEQLVDVLDEYHCDAIVVGGEIQFASASRYFLPVLRALGSVTGSHTLPTGSPESTALLKLNREVIAAMGIADGLTHLEVFGTPDGYVVGEIACRPGGGGVPEVLSRKFGIDTLGLFLTSAMGDPIDFQVDEADGVFLWCNLPLRHGTVVEVSQESDFQDIPEVFSVNIVVAAGDTVGGTLYSTTMAGVVFARMDDVGDVPRVVKEIEKRFTIRYDDESP